MVDALRPVLFGPRRAESHAQMSALEVEHLTGDNQYACEHCGRKVDATRQLRLRTLPPYLCLSLKRFVFDLRVRTQAFGLSRSSPSLVMRSHKGTRNHSNHPSATAERSLLSKSRPRAKQRK